MFPFPALCLAAATLALGLATTASGADAQDAHRRGLQAFHRGDVTTAMSLLRGPADRGHAPSQALLAFILDRADFPEEALRLYRAAAGQDDPEGHAGLAGHYLTGRGIAKDEKRALEHFSKAAELGHAASINALADAHLKGQMGLGTEPRDHARAQADLRRAAEAGHLPAIDALARAYRDGSFGLAADAAQAATWQERGKQLRQQRATATPKAGG